MATRILAVFENQIDFIKREGRCNQAKKSNTIQKNRR